jgi:hypothetical protein
MCASAKMICRQEEKRKSWSFNCVCVSRSKTLSSLFSRLDSIIIIIIIIEKYNIRNDIKLYRFTFNSCTLRPEGG